MPTAWNWRRGIGSFTESLQEGGIDLVAVRCYEDFLEERFDADLISMLHVFAIAG